MRKHIKIIALVLLMAAAMLYGGHLVRQARQQKQAYDTVAQHPIKAVQTIALDQLQFDVKASYFDGSGYVDCVLATQERPELYVFHDVVQIADEELEQAVRAVVASLGAYTHDWSAERPAVTPGKSYPSLSFFAEEQKIPFETFMIDGNALRWTTQIDDGWLVCTYTADRDALQTVSGKLYELYLNRESVQIG